MGVGESGEKAAREGRLGCRNLQGKWVSKEELWRSLWGEKFDELGKE